MLSSLNSKGDDVRTSVGCLKNGTIMLHKAGSNKPCKIKMGSSGYTLKLAEKMHSRSAPRDSVALESLMPKPYRVLFNILRTYSYWSPFEHG